MDLLSPFPLPLWVLRIAVGLG
ncbi:MAG: hypothetical protein QOI99_1633, partial [Actinomycetota bacterium]|nr:hypothetical protein [Actinomycetota bacterium]